MVPDKSKIYNIKKMYKHNIYMYIFNSFLVFQN